MKTFDVVVRFINSEEIIIKNCSAYTLGDNGFIIVGKNEYRMYLNNEQVMYIARKFDIKNEGN